MSNEIDWEESFPRRVAYRVRKPGRGDYYDDEGYGEFDRRRSSVGYKRRKNYVDIRDEEDGDGDRDADAEDERKCDPPPNTPSSDIESASQTTASSHTLRHSELDSSSPLPSPASLHTLGRSEMTYSSPSIASSHTLGRSELGPSAPSIASSHTLRRSEIGSPSPSPTSSRTVGRSELGSPPPSTWDTSLSGVHCGVISSSSEGSEFKSESESESSDEGNVFREMYKVGSAVRKRGG